MTALISPTGATIDVPDAVVGDYIEQGYTDPGAPAAPPQPDETWTVKQLAVYAAEHDIDLPSHATKAEKLDLLRAAHDG